MAAFRSALATCDLHKMVTKLGLHRTVNLTDLTAEHDLVKLGHHHAGTERAKVAALLRCAAPGCSSEAMTMPRMLLRVDSEPMSSFRSSKTRRHRHADPKRVCGLAMLTRHGAMLECLLLCASTRWRLKED